MRVPKSDAGRILIDYMSTTLDNLQTK
jgi:hypothetical protein